MGKNVWMAIALSLQFVYFQLLKRCLPNSTQYKNWWCWKSSIWIVLKSCYCQTSWYLFAGFKTMILNSVHPKTKLCLFSVKIWFVKTSIRIAKYESQVVDLNLYYDFFSFRWMRWWGCWQLNKLSMIQMCLFPSVSHIDSHLFHEWWKSLLDYQKNYF